MAGCRRLTLSGEHIATPCRLTWLLEGSCQNHGNSASRLIPEVAILELTSVARARALKPGGPLSTLIASAMDTAVEAALLRPHFLMSAPPRVATVLVKVVCSHSSSPMTSRAGSPPMRAFRKSGTCQ